MNLTEKKMVELLVELKEKYNVTGVKAEFEAEGTRIEEALRLKEVSLKAGLGMTIKIGGCEAIKDMFEAAAIGVEHLVGPMVETPYALKKYIKATQTAFNEDLRKNIDFLINVETITTVKNFDEMLKIPEIDGLDGIVVGRVDMTGSMGLNRDSVNKEEILKITTEIAVKAKEKKLDVVVGGAVSVDSLAFFKALPAGSIDRFETRKVVFQCPGALSNTETAFLKAVEFEILWLKNKKAYYGSIFREDDSRLMMMEERYKNAIEKINSLKS